MIEDINEYLRRIFKYVLNYEAEDISEPIDPLTYNNPEGDNCLHIAASMGEERAIGYLIASGLDVNARGDMGSTALHYARKAGHSGAIKLLLDNGANPDLINEFGERALG